MESPAANPAIESVEVVEKGVLSDVIHAVVNGVENGIEKIENSIVNTVVNRVENGIDKIEDCIAGLVDNVEHIIESFTFSLPFNQDSKPGSDQENLGNNIYLPSPSPNSAPYRFGIHIKRDDLGYRIARIFQDTFAHHAKLQENDILTHLDDTELSSTNIVKVIALFSTVGNPFSLTILRKMESGERTEMVIQITTNIDEVERSIEIQVTVRRPQYTPDRCDPMPPSYITQDLDEGSQQYVNIASNGNLVMGHEQVPFVLEKYFTIYNSDGPLLTTLKTTDGDRVFDFTQQKMVPSNPRRLARYLMIVRADNDGSVVFEQLDRQGNNDKRFINNSNNQIVVSRLESPDSVPMSGRFVIYSADDEATTTTTNRRGGGRTRHVNGAH